MPRDPRTYITVHDGMPDHPKVEPLSDAAFRLMVETWCWCSRHHTDGFIRNAVWLRRGCPETRQELVDAELVELTDAGAQMHDYTEHQRTAAEIAQLSEKRSEAGRRGGQASVAKRQASAQASAKQTVKQTGSKVQAETDTDTETDKHSATQSVARTRGTRLPNPFAVAAELVEQMRQECPNVDQQYEYLKFIDYWEAQPGQKGVKTDWQATYRNWIRRAAERTTPRKDFRQQATDDLFAAAMTRAIERDRQQEAS